MDTILSKRVNGGNPTFGLRDGGRLPLERLTSSRRCEAVHFPGQGSATWLGRHVLVVHGLHVLNKQLREPRIIMGT